eukprot:TRINITY_DN24523_c0_g1_i3.p1 TRINITY_DN24523_c0_g1~~TRINITY_DN24523_c0_g1_i3.p1  ORF type:complete len:150 (+),score=6.19 TRINITY_DN24523_c0_g1_i3:183-632(+)
MGTMSTAFGVQGSLVVPQSEHVMHSSQVVARAVWAGAFICNALNVGYLVMTLVRSQPLLLGYCTCFCSLYVVDFALRVCSKRQWSSLEVGIIVMGLTGVVGCALARDDITRFYYLTSLKCPIDTHRVGLTVHRPMQRGAETRADVVVRA